MKKKQKTKRKACRKYSSEHLLPGFTSVGPEDNLLPVCVLCSEVLQTTMRAPLTSRNKAWTIFIKASRFFRKQVERVSEPQKSSWIHLSHWEWKRQGGGDFRPSGKVDRPDREATHHQGGETIFDTELIHGFKWNRLGKVCGTKHWWNTGHGGETDWSCEKGQRRDSAGYSWGWSYDNSQPYQKSTTAITPFCHIVRGGGEWPPAASPAHWSPVAFTRRSAHSTQSHNISRILLAWTFRSILWLQVAVQVGLFGQHFQLFKRTQSISPRKNEKQQPCETVR